MKKQIALAIAVAVVASLAVMAQVSDLRPTQLSTYTNVTEEMLRNPSAGDWLNWRRTDSNWGYSTLSEINRQNVNQMQLAWSWAMDDTGANEAAPLVHDGIMYLPNPRGVIQALDGISGATLGVLTALVVADLTNGTGRFNLAQGLTGTLSGVGASLSTSISGLGVGKFGDTAGFLGVTVVALAAVAMLWAFMPETKPALVRQRRTHSPSEESLR